MYILTALLCGPLSAQTAPAAAPEPSPPPSDLQTPTFSARSTLVLVPTLVKNHAGELVYTLTAKDFTLTDNGIEQKLSLEDDSGSQPLALVVAIQTGAAGARQFDYYSHLATYIENIIGGVTHQVAVVTFDSEPTLTQKFSPDLTLMADSVQNLGPGDNGAAILDALAFSVDLLRKQPPQYRRAILLLSETLDHGSKETLQDALRTISDNNTAIYSLAFNSSKSEMKHEGAQLLPGMTYNPPPGPAGGCMSKDKDPDQDPDAGDNRLTQALNCLYLLAPPLRAAKMISLLAMNGFHHNVPETVARLTGGEYFSFNNAKSLERGLFTLSNHVPNRYVLSFHPQSPTPGIHAISVQLKNYANLTLTARSSYWADDAITTQPHP